MKMQQSTSWTKFKFFLKIKQRLETRQDELWSILRDLKEDLNDIENEIQLHTEPAAGPRDNENEYDDEYIIFNHYQLGTLKTKPQLQR